MAEKRSKSILSGLKNMLHRDSEKPPESAPKSTARARKKPAAPVTEEPAPAKQSAEEQPSADVPADQQSAPDAKSDKKVKTQPWYQHRQRW